MKATALKNRPNDMQVIINIQGMKEHVYSLYDKFSDFKNLELLSTEQLHRLQERLIPEYNKAIKTI